MLTYLIYFAIIIFIIGISFAYYYGILDKLEIHTITLSSWEWMYYTIRGDYSKKMAIEYENISNAIYGSKAAHQAYNRAGKLMLGIYYDNPYTHKFFV